METEASLSIRERLAQDRLRHYLWPIARRLEWKWHYIVSARDLLGEMILAILERDAREPGIWDDKNLSYIAWYAERRAWHFLRDWLRDSGKLRWDESGIYKSSGIEILDGDAPTRATRALGSGTEEITIFDSVEAPDPWGAVNLRLAVAQVLQGEDDLTRTIAAQVAAGRTYQQIADDVGFAAGSAPHRRIRKLRALFTEEGVTV